MARRKRADTDTYTGEGGDGAAEPGHNGGGGVILTDDQKEALFHHHMNKVRPAIAAVATAVSQLRALYNVAKADGISKKDIEFAKPDGISLTLAEVNAGTLLCWIIPHTAAVSNLRAIQPGDRVNLEFDMIGKYVARQARPPGGSPA